MKLKIKTLKYLSSLSFVLIGLFSLLHTLIYTPQYWVRDFVILVILSSPLIVNRRLFYIAFGILSGIISLVITIIFFIKKMPNHSESSLSFYLFGLMIYLMIFSSSLTMIYIGTYSELKGKFRLV